jgi:uncharacterized protein YlxP (DUF503 family)
MLIGAGRLVLEFFGNQNVSLKRRNLEELCATLRKQFNLSILEIADFEDPERCVIGFAAAIPENWKVASAQSLCDKICRTIDETAFARVTVEDWDILEHGGEDWEAPEAPAPHPDLDLIQRKLRRRKD